MLAAFWAETHTHVACPLSLPYSSELVPMASAEEGIAAYMLARARPKMLPRSRPAVAKATGVRGEHGDGGGGSGDGRRGRSRTPPAVRVLRWLERPGVGPAAGVAEAELVAAGLSTAAARQELAERLLQIFRTDYQGEVAINSLGFAKAIDLSRELDCSVHTLRLLVRMERAGNPQLELLEHGSSVWIRRTGGVALAVVNAYDLRASEQWTREE